MLPELIKHSLYTIKSYIEACNLSQLEYEDYGELGIAAEYYENLVDLRAELMTIVNNLPKD